MANSRSARKQIRAAARKHERNKGVRASVRTYVGKARRALLEPGEENIQATVLAAVRALDRAAEKGIIHRNNARRRKSRLTAMAARLLQVGEGDSDAARATAAGTVKGQTKASRKPAAAKAKAKSAAKATTAAKATAGKSATKTATKTTATAKPSTAAKPSAAAKPSTAAKAPAKTAAKPKAAAKPKDDASA